MKPFLHKVVFVIVFVTTTEWTLTTNHDLLTQAHQPPLAM